MFFVRVFQRELSFIKKKPTQYITYMALLTALSTVLMFMFHFPILSAVSFLKFDFADVPVVVGGLTFGPLAVVIIALVKNLFHLMQTNTGGIGELSNFICALAFCLPITFIYNAKRGSKTMLAIAFGAGVVLQIVAAIASNYFLIVPAYVKAFHLKPTSATYILIHTTAYYLGWVPLFNLIKFASAAVIGFLLYKGIEPVLKKTLFIESDRTSWGFRPPQKAAAAPPDSNPADC